VLDCSRCCGAQQSSTRPANRAVQGHVAVGAIEWEVKHKKGRRVGGVRLAVCAAEASCFGCCRCTSCAGVVAVGSSGKTCERA
jgi:hypothetical protein